MSRRLRAGDLATFHRSKDPREFVVVDASYKGELGTPLVKLSASLYGPSGPYYADRYDAVLVTFAGVVVL